MESKHTRHAQDLYITLETINAKQYDAIKVNHLKNDYIVLHKNFCDLSRKNSNNVLCEIKPHCKYQDYIQVQNKLLKHYILSEKELMYFRNRKCKLYKVGKCENSDKCPYSHSETWQRRNPTTFFYASKLCSSLKFVKQESKMILIGKCNEGKVCSYAHSKEEELYHPDRYKTKMCLNFPKCYRFYCPFAHGFQEIRHLNKDHYNTNFYVNIQQLNLKSNASKYRGKKKLLSLLHHENFTIPHYFKNIFNLYEEKTRAQEKHMKKQKEINECVCNKVDETEVSLSNSSEYLSNSLAFGTPVLLSMFQKPLQDNEYSLNFINRTENCMKKKIIDDFLCSTSFQLGSIFFGSNS